MRSVTTPDGVVWRYRYDSLGRRITKQQLTTNSSATPEGVRFAWDGSILCEQTTEGTLDPVSTTWDHDGLRVLTQAEVRHSSDTPQEVIDERFFNVVGDLTTTPAELLDESGTIAWRTRTTLWGSTTWTRNSSAYTPLRFPGQYFDTESELHYNCFRYYDPETARYLTTDPLGLPPSPNPRTYVPNPHLWIDSLGLAPDCPPETRSHYRGESQNNPGGQLGPPVSVNQLKMEMGRAGMSVSDYDIVHIPEIRTPDGIAFGNSPHTAAGFPMKGPRDLPLIEISDIGLRSLDEAVATIHHEMFHHKHFEVTRRSHNPWGGSEQAAEDYGQQMLEQFQHRTGS